MKFDQFLSLVSKDKVETTKKFEKDFVTFLKPGTLTVTTVGFLLSMSDDAGWQRAKELIELFKPSVAWIGTEENRTKFKDQIKGVSVEPYSFFGSGGYIPVAVIPTSMLKNKQLEKS